MVESHASRYQHKENNKYSSSSSWSICTRLDTVCVFGSKIDVHIS